MNNRLTNNPYAVDNPAPPRYLYAPMDIQLALQTHATLGEGAIWDPAAARLYWVDILGFTLHVFNPDTGQDSAINVGEPIGTVVPWQPGIVMTALRERFASVTLDSGSVQTICTIPPQPTPVRFNDGKCDPAGRFWAGTLALNKQPFAGTLYSLDPQGQLTERLNRVTTSNGIVWSANAQTLYYIDTPTGGADAFDFDSNTGAIANRRRILTFPTGQGRPDGMTIDEEGMLWIAHWEGGCVSRWDPETGRQILRIELPVPRVSSCAFGGPTLDTLYITTASTGLSDQDKLRYPLSGSLFAVNPGTRGVPATPFAAP